jgi:hypothetical protein
VRRRAAPDDLDVAIRAADIPLADAGHHLGARRRLAALFAEDAELAVEDLAGDGEDRLGHRVVEGLAAEAGP